MAEIKDIYSLEFNASQFTAELDAAISRIEELNSAMEDGADATEALADAENNLVAILKTDAKTTEGLNQKRDALVKTQKTLNSESKTGVAVGKQVDATNKQLAASTGQVVKQQKSLGGQLLQGARSLNSLKRAAGLVTGAFRLLGAFNPLGMFLMVLPTVVGWFQKLTGTTDKGAEAMEKLKDSSLGYTERLNIIQDELQRLEAVEARRGYLTEQEKENRQELTAMYQKTADEIVKIEEERAERLLSLEQSIASARARLLGNTIAGAQATFEADRDRLRASNNKLWDQLQEDQKKAQAELLKATARYNMTSSIEDNKRMMAAQKSLDDNLKAQEKLIAEQSLQIEILEQERNEKINQINEEAKRKREAFNKKMADDEALDNERRNQEILDETEKFIEEQNKIYEEGLAKRKAAEEAYLLSVSLKIHEEELKQLQDNLNIASQYRQANAETNLNIALLNLEKQRNEELLAAFGNAQAQAEIDKEYNEKRAAFEKMASEEVLKIRIEFLKKLRDASGSDPMMVAEINKTITELELKLEELGKSAAGNAETVKMSLKEIISETGQIVQEATDAVFSVLNSQIQSYVQALDRAVDKSKSTLDDIRANSENFNARQLELERERLEKLEEERRKAIEREKKLALIQLTINSTLAIAKAAAEGGAAAPFTIASTIIALLAGFASARAAAGNAFFEGSEYVDRNNRYPNGRDTVPARLNKGERVITTDKNQQYWDSLSAIHHGRIPADVINDFVNNYKKSGSPSMDSIFLSDFGVKPIVFNGADNSGLESRLGRIEAALLELPKYMPKTTVTANANGIFKLVERRQKAKEFSRNRAK